MESRPSLHLIMLVTCVLLAGCVGATRIELEGHPPPAPLAFTLPRLFTATYAVEHPTQPGEVTVSLGATRRILDAEGVPREVLTLTLEYRLRDPKAASRMVSTAGIESIDLEELRIVGQEAECRPAFPVGRTCDGYVSLYFGLEGYPAILGLGAFDGVRLESGHLDIDWWSRWGFEQARYEVEPAPGGDPCYVVTLHHSFSHSYDPGYHLRFTGLADRVTFCKGVAMPSEIAVDGAVLSLIRLVVTDDSPIPRNPAAERSRISSNTPVPFEKEPVVNGFPPEGKPKSELGFAEALEWARGHDEGLRTYLKTSRDVALMFTRTSLDGEAGTEGVDETTWHLRTIVLQDLASDRHFTFTVEKKVTRLLNDFVPPRVEYRMIEPHASIAAPTVRPSVVGGDMVTLASARGWIAERFSPDIAISGLRSQLPRSGTELVNLENRFLHYFWFSRAEGAGLKVLEGVMLDASSGRVESMLVRGDEWLPLT